MNHLRQLCAAVVLTFALVLPAFAGDIQIGKDAPPPPSTTTQGHISIPLTEGHIEIGVASTDPATEVTLSLLQSLLSLF